MVNYFIYAKQFSELTTAVKIFHRNGLKTLEQFKNDVRKIEKELLVAGEPPSESKIIYLHWNEYCWDVDEDKAREAYMDLYADSHSTKPESIIKYLKQYYPAYENDKIKLLYIITNGIIDKDSAWECSKLNNDMHYETVVFHVFNENLKTIDLSAATSFFKKRCVVYRNNKLFDNTDISKEFDYDKVNIYNFLAERNQLKSYIKMKFINKFHLASEEVEKLRNLRDRLLDELLLEKKSRGHKDVYLKTKNKNLFLHKFVHTDWYKNLTNTVYADKFDIRKSISALVNYIDRNVRSYSFKFYTKFDMSLKKDQNDIKFTEIHEIDFPNVIISSSDKKKSVVFLTECNVIRKIIYYGTRKIWNMTPVSFSNLKLTMECPLFLMNNVSESIDSSHTLNEYRKMKRKKAQFDLGTLKLFHGGIVLLDTNQFDEYNDYILSATYFNGTKIEYNIGIFYYVLWKNCENKEWMDRNVVEQFKKYAMRRISETVCNIGLSSFPLVPQVNTTLPTALWYCVELSSGIFKNDPEHFKQEKLREYYNVAPYMIEILTWFNYDLDLESIEKRRELISYVMTLKKIQKRREKIYYLLKKIFKTVDGFLVSEIENPSNLYKLNYLKLNPKEILRDNIIEEKVYLNDYVHLMHCEGNLEASKAGTGTFEICEKTFRPYFAIDKETSYYTELVKNTKKVIIKNDDDEEKIEVTYQPIDSLELNRVLSLPKLFIDFVKEFKKYPTLPEYVKFVSTRKKFHGDLVTLFPSNFYFDIKDMYERYQKVVKKVGVKEFLKVCESHVERVTRIKAEGRVKFNSDIEISEFITNEELKVKLNSNHI